MNLILLNSVYPKIKNTKMNNNKHHLLKKLKSVETKKIDNMKETLSFVHNIGQSDIDFVTNMHNNIVKDFESIKENIIIDIAPSKNATFEEEEEDIFDN